MTRTASFGNNVYSVDMMFAYINIMKPEYKVVDIEKFDKFMNDKCWRDNDEVISPAEVLSNPKKYKCHYNSIHKANLDYPIVMSESGILFDGAHRIVKSIILKKKTIKVYYFNKTVLKKFLLNTKGDYKLENMEPNDFIELFYKRFIQ